MIDARQLQSIGDSRFNSLSHGEVAESQTLGSGRNSEKASMLNAYLGLSNSASNPTVITRENREDQTRV